MRAAGVYRKPWYGDAPSATCTTTRRLRLQNVTAGAKEREMHTYIHTLRSDDGRTPRFRDPMARLVLVSVSEKGGGGSANSVPEKNIIDYSGRNSYSTLSPPSIPKPPASSAVSWALRPPGLDPLLVDWLVLGQRLRKRGGALFFAAHGPHALALHRAAKCRHSIAPPLLCRHCVRSSSTLTHRDRKVCVSHLRVSCPALHTHHFSCAKFNEAHGPRPRRPPDAVGGCGPGGRRLYAGHH